MRSCCKMASATSWAVAMAEAMFHQHEFARALTDPDLPVPDGINGPAPRRFAVYRNNVAVSLINALGEIFPTVKRLVGDEFFALAARAYCAETPPTSRLLFEYGADFGDFLDRFEPAAEHPYLGDCARLERAWLDAFHEADCPSIGLDTLAAFPAEALATLRVNFHPAARVLALRHAALSIVSADRNDEPLDGIDPFLPEDALVVRPHYDVALWRLPPGAAGFCAHLQDGAPLGEAAAFVTARQPDFDLPTTLRLMFESGAVAKIQRNDP